MSVITHIWPREVLEKGLNMQHKSRPGRLLVTRKEHQRTAAEKFSLSVRVQQKQQHRRRQPAELGLNALMCKNAIVLDLVVNKAVKRRQKISFFPFFPQEPEKN